MAKKNRICKEVKKKKSYTVKVFSGKGKWETIEDSNASFFKNNKSSFNIIDFLIFILLHQIIFDIFFMKWSYFIIKNVYYRIYFSAVYLIKI